MKKDDAIALRERLVALAARTTEKAGLPALADDGKLFHDEVDGTARWTFRLAVPERWPHRYDLPGLRLEAWCYQGKSKPDEEVLLAALCSDGATLESLRAALGAVFGELVSGGKYARRYKALDAAVTRFYPAALGIYRLAPVQAVKLEAAWSQLVLDVVKPLTAAVEAWDVAGERRAALAEAAAPDPMEALRRKFNG